MEPSCAMGHPQHAAHSSHGLEDPTISVEDWFDEEESGAWCVDTGPAISVMTSRSIYDAVANGELSPDMKVWRDGRAFWLPIAECYELTVKQPEKRAPTPVSGVRRVQRRSLTSTLPTPLTRPTSPLEPPRVPAIASEDRPTLMLTTSFVVGVLIGALLYLPFAW